MLKIVNIAAPGSINREVDLNALSVIGDRYTYNPEIYPGGYIKLSSAKITVTGPDIISSPECEEGGAR